MEGVMLDAGGLIAVDRNDRHAPMLLGRAIESGRRITGGFAEPLAGTKNANRP